MHKIETESRKINVNMLVVNHFPIVIYETWKTQRKPSCEAVFMVNYHVCVHACECKCVESHVYVHACSYKRKGERSHECFPFFMLRGI